MDTLDDDVRNGLEWLAENDPDGEDALRKFLDACTLAFDMHCLRKAENTRKAVEDSEPMPQHIRQTITAVMGSLKTYELTHERQEVA